MAADHGTKQRALCVVSNSRGHVFTSSQLARECAALPRCHAGLRRAPVPRVVEHRAGHAPLLPDRVPPESAGLRDLRRVRRRRRDGARRRRGTECATQAPVDAAATRGPRLAAAAGSAWRRAGTLSVAAEAAAGRGIAGRCKRRPQSPWLKGWRRCAFCIGLQSGGRLGAARIVNFGRPPGNAGNNAHHARHLPSPAHSACRW